MTHVRITGIAVTALDVVDYGIGTLAAYPGRASSATTVMVDTTLWTIGGDVW